jgi:hypothetical protein
MTTIGVLIALTFLAMAVVWWRRAPAVTAACAGALVAGGYALHLVTHHLQYRYDAPATVALGVSGGLGLAGLVGLLATAHGEATALRRSGVVLLLLAPFVGGCLWTAFEIACPMYIGGPSAGICRYGEDVVGGWLGPTAVLGALDVAVLGLLLLVSARIATSADR